MQLLNSTILGKGRPLLILHGFLGMGDNWKTLGMRYAQGGFEVHLIDHRNHGKSFHSDIFDYDVMVEDILHYADAHSIDEFSVIGHSMGGKAAMFLAVKHPNRIDKLIVADISTRYYPPHHQDILKALNVLHGSNFTERREADVMLSEYLPSKDLRMFLLKNLYREQNSQNLSFRINLPILTLNVNAIGEALENMCYKGSALFLKGGASDYIGERDIPIIREIFPQAEFTTIENAGHWLHAEKPEIFLKLSLSYLET